MRKIAIALAVFCSFQMFASAFTVPGNPVGFVNDYANILSGGTKQKLEEEIRSFNASTSNEIAVVTITTLDGDTVENYATKLFESWKIGKAKEDNGILLLIAKDDHKLRIEVGYGLEGALPDILAKDIIDNKITPSFKQGDYDAGVIHGVKAIMEAVQGEYKAIGSSKKNSLVNKNSIEFFLVAVFFLFQFLSSILARSKSWWAGGVLGGVVGFFVTIFHFFGVTLIVGSVITFVLVLLGLFFDYIVSSTYKKSIMQGGGIPWWIGGGRGGSGGSSSFGGFGGGSSGGGGASGSW